MDIFLNSKTCNRKINNESSDCYFHLPALEIDTLKERVFIKVKSASIPYSWYNVNDYNNILDLLIDGDNRSFSIPIGNYNVNTLLIEINLLLIDFDITLSYVLKTNHIIFNSPSIFTFLASSTIDEILGFNNNVSYISHEIIIDSVTSYKLESVNGFNLFQVRQIYISSDNFQIDNMSNHNPNNRSTLLAVQVLGNPNSIITYNDSSENSHEIHNVTNLTNLHIKLTDEMSRPLLLNRMNWSLTISIIFKKR